MLNLSQLSSRSSTSPSPVQGRLARNGRMALLAGLCLGCLASPSATLPASSLDANSPAADSNVAESEVATPKLAEPKVQDSNPAAPTQEQDSLAATREHKVGEARKALEQGDLAEAQAILTDLLAEDYVNTAESLLAQDNPQDAMNWIGRALDIQPKNRLVHSANARANLALGKLGMGPLLFEDALVSYARCKPTPATYVGSSEAAYNLFRFEDAVRFAQRAIDANARLEQPMQLELTPERALSLAAFQAYTQAQQAEADQKPDEAQVHALFARSESALGAELGHTPLDPFVHKQLSDLYLWAKRPSDSLSALERGLDLLPENQELWDAYSQLSYQSEADAVANFKRFTEKHPDVALGHWYWARASFDDAKTGLFNPPAEDGSEDVQMARENHFSEVAALFELSERRFAKTTELAADYAEACLGWQVMCRNGAGWCDFNAGDLESAIAGFCSMDELVEGGITWQLEGELLSGVQGLAFVADAYNRDQKLAEAAGVFDQLSGYEPEEVSWANNAGFFHRDAGTAVEVRARSLRRAEEGSITNEEVLIDLRETAGVAATEVGTTIEKERFGKLAASLEAEAAQHYESSYSAYLVASKLAPEDVRIVNDTALIAIYHLGRDLELAEEMLMQSVNSGIQQMKTADELDESQLYELKNAWGDAHQNLGVLYLNYRDKPEIALGWLEKSLEIGPDPRPAVEGMLATSRRLLQERGLAAPTSDTGSDTPAETSGEDADN